jgi:hypothetical protein
LDPEGVDGAQQEADFSSWFTLFHFHDPLPADADFPGERLLVESEFDAAIPNECAEVGWGSNSHMFLSRKSRRTATFYQSRRSTTTGKVAERRHIQMSANEDTKGGTIQL